MRANELMIGDWVQDITPCVIDAVGNEDICTYRNVDGYKTANPSNLKPIPLTKEIVEKNGFKSTPAFGERAMLKETFEIWIDFKEKRHWINIIVPTPIKSELHLHYYEGYVEYVHEFQHLLRDCELFTLADNFKVE